MHKKIEYRYIKNASKDFLFVDIEIIIKKLIKEKNNNNCID